MNAEATVHTDILTPQDTGVEDSGSLIQDESLGKSLSIQDAVDRLVMSYSIAKSWDAAQYAEDYVNRPVATLEDVFGSADLEYESDTGVITKVRKRRTAIPSAAVGSQAAHLAAAGAESVGPGLGSFTAGVVSSLFSPRVRYRTVIEKTYHFYLYWKKSKGREGFFSRALAAVDDVFILVPPTTRRILELKRGSEVLKKLDTRKEKREVVLEYMEQIARNLTTGEA